ncbi:MAG: DUF1460 domain-containing protein [Deltaproteobacteria bacterium]|nr:DUF1460 domain-containing protein [Deltaproteobacteria bacterium]MBW2253108.1 DUF1460 domain-containing protein [Deltaproteobacteria bacterium]
MLLFLILALPARAASPPGSTEVDLFTQGDPEKDTEILAEARTTPAPSGALVPAQGSIPAEVLDAARSAHLLPLAERMKAVSEPLLGQPYMADPLGEGSGMDADPLARYDAFDCLTLVEEVLALSLAGDPVHATPIRLGLRYAGDEHAYATRRHFMELQWLPAALENQWLRETTAEYGVVASYHREVTPALWANWGRRSLFALTDEQLPTGEMRLDYLPLEAAIEAVDRIRPGSIVMTVREDRPWVPIWITHLGFTVPAETPTLRHASRMKSAQVSRDHSLSWYLEHLRTYKNWKAAGIAIFEPVEFGPRLSLLPAAPVGKGNPGPEDRREPSD